MKEVQMTNKQKQDFIKGKMEVDRENKTITINGQEYKYNAFSIFNDGVKIYRGNEIFVKF